MIFSLVDGRADAWQWDTGLSLNVDTSEHQISEVHMSNSSTKGAFVCEIKPDRTVEIPNILLTTDGDINIYAIISDEEGERTVIKERLHVHRKKKPQDYVYTETEVYEYKDYITRLESVENTVLKAGNVYTLSPDEGAFVNVRVSVNEDNSKTYYIDFYIPEGQQGEQGEPGDPGSPGANGKTPYIQNGYWYIDGVNLGVRAEGTPGTSVTITRITESTESGGTNTVEFSDGNRLNVRNGNDGEDGEGGGGGVIGETDPTVPNWAKQPQKPKYDASEITFIQPDSQSILPSGTVDDALGEIDLFLRGVPSWSLNPTKPSYTASEVGALPASTKIPTKTSELENDSEYVQLDDLSPYAKKNDIPPEEIYVGDGTMPNTATLQIIVDEDEIVTSYTLDEIVDAVLAALPNAEGVGF